MLKRYKILDKEVFNQDGSEKQWGILEYDTDAKKFKIILEENLEYKSAPIFFDYFVKEGIREIPHKYAIKWVKNRLIPPNRQNIGAIMRDMGIEEYDEFKFLTWVKGRCVQDAMHLEEF